MEKVAEFTSGHVSELTPAARGEGHRDSGSHRSGGSREKLRIDLKRTRLQRHTLTISTALLLLACSGLALWASSQQSAFDVAVGREQAQNKRLIGQLTVATIELEESRRAVDALVTGRIPGLLPFRVGEPLPVDTHFVREFSCRPAGPLTSDHECKLVIENDSSSAIRPTLSVLLFDDVGVQLVRAQLMDGVHDELRADEIRSFFASLEIAEDKAPRYFLLTSD
jgi:hypothetical protein